MSQHEAPAGDSAATGAPSGETQQSIRTDAADPAMPGRHRKQRIGSAGGGTYPVGTGTSDGREPSKRGDES
jgi:hypothetical protein